ncbi:pepsin/retropepsin-like aspartic protease family protein [Pedobacter sp. Hv1]|uniref:pepsin/retropepsin-like aspartic protease family protein n=1 Tax=Pedobacter sp. Hv1 TaxID=1740090 RepID=UPI0006D8AFC3|nr:pepsin/retropepsin-like aspartic protease family protein [Pedobacter sp. Hv1]KQB98736.1 hypothetical protein AQF98_20555 [Pedobacter sp. Hv1]
MKYRINQIKPPFIIFIFTLIGLQICFSGDSYAQKFTFPNGIKRDAIAFKKVKNLIIIPIFINGKGPFNFLLDTGVDPLIITDVALIDSLNIRDVRPVKINGVGAGKEINALYSVDPAINVGEASMSNMPTVILKEDVFNLSGYLGVKISGLIGFYFFNSFVVKINYYTNRVSFRLPETKGRIRGVKLDLEILENKPYINTLLTSPNLGEIPAKLIIDCGASHALSLEMYKDNLFPIPTPSIPGNLGVGLSGEISGDISRINSIKLGTYTIKNVLTNFPNYNEVAAKTKQKGRNGNLGADILKNFHVTFDYSNNAMYLKKNNYFGTPFEHDMSGMEIYVQNDAYPRFIISRIEVGSQAEKAGFKVSDEIISVNFKSTEAYTLDELTSLLKSDRGRTVLIEIVRDKSILIKLLTLKSRI